MIDGIGGIGPKPIPTSGDSKAKLNIAENVGTQIGLMYLRDKKAEANLDIISVRARKAGNNYDVTLEFKGKDAYTRFIDYELLQKTIDKFLSGKSNWLVEIDKNKSTLTQVSFKMWPPPVKNKN